ncbi:type II secretion system F family protein [Paraburkholderia rhizosphaerae]|uniref:General secretion pathway protein F n=1 Tax=Paraburkholderia rhizosphaerae TaxID=480658 RepID=A0A4R8L3W3_9BURK|nr:type II secretion system F family protein [Paraburkholderia rhizosphaerae]TDY37163.1 general secretion pathway protein F [Paraburkholderia rhizosphaerae]
MQVVEVRAAHVRAADSSRPHFSVVSRLRAARFDVSLFACELLALLRAGLTLTESLEALDERSRRGKSATAMVENDHRVLSGLILSMQQGKSLSSALNDYPDQFPGLFVAMLAASEHTGELPQALERYLQYHAQVSVVRQKLISASLYPAMLLLVGVSVAFFLICFLAPRFGHVYDGMTHVELPAMSRWLIGFGLLVSDHAVASTLCVAAALTAIIAALMQPAVRQKCVALTARLTWIGQILKLSQLARFYRSVSMLLHGGVALLPALDITRHLLGGALQSGLARSMACIAQGKTLSESLQQTDLLTPIAQRLLRAGERNGQIAGMLEQAALFHEREISQWVERFSRLVEPVLMLLMGLGIGLIVVLLYLPIFDLAGSLQ